MIRISTIFAGLVLYACQMAASQFPILLPASVEERFGWSPLGSVVTRIESVDSKTDDIRFSIRIGEDVWEPDDLMAEKLGFYAGGRVFIFASPNNSKWIRVHVEARRLQPKENEKVQAELVLEFGVDGFVSAELRDVIEGAPPALQGVGGIGGMKKRGEQATTGNDGKSSLPSAKPEARRP